MNAVYEAQIDLGAEAYPPDPWPSAVGIHLPLDHVVSRGSDQAPLSRLADYVWDWTPYHPRKKRSMLCYFYWREGGKRASSVRTNEITPDRIARIRQMQHLMSLIIYRRIGPPLSVGTLHHYLYTLVRVARHGEKHSTDVQGVLGDKKRLDALITSISSYECRGLFQLLSLLYTWDPGTEIGFEVVKPRKLGLLQQRASQHLADKKQTAPLPTRIYSLLINGLTQELSDIEAHVERLEKALALALTEHEQWKRDGSKLRPSIGADLVQQFGLTDFLVRRGRTYTLPSLAAVIGDIQTVCALVIHTFTGMRAEEAQHLPFHCLELEKGRHGQPHFLVIGATTKLVGARHRRTRWVTNQEGHRAIRLAQRLALIIYQAHRCVPQDGDATMDDFPLFVSTDYLPWGKRPKNTPDAFRPASSLSLSSASDHVRQTLCPVITHPDLEELEEIDPHRAWRSEPEFQLGQPWPLASHQLRRSLALYAQRSGLVTLSSLRRQLQHITREMSLYYSKGSVFARNFIEDDPEDYQQHICREWRETGSESAGLAYLRDVLLADEPLFGGAGNFVEQARKRGKVMSREETMKRFKQGLLTYKANPLGGCTNPMECTSDTKGISFLDVPCLRDQCKHLIAKESNLRRVIPYQQNLVNSLDPSSVSYDMEKRELDALINACEAMQANTSEKSNV